MCCRGFSEPSPGSFYRDIHDCAQRLETRYLTYQQCAHRAYVVDVEQMNRSLGIARRRHCPRTPGPCRASPTGADTLERAFCRSLVQPREGHDGRERLESSQPQNEDTGGFLMPDDAALTPVLVAALADAQQAVVEYDGACAWLLSVASEFTDPLAVEVWVLDPALTQVLLVEHQWRGWVPPGGAAKPGENPRDAAARELLEETGLRVPLLERPAAVTVRSYHPNWPATLGLSYVAVVETFIPVVAEPAQQVSWTPLAQPWMSSFADDRARIGNYAAWLARSERE